MGGVLEVRLVHGEDSVAHLQHIALVRWTARNDVLYKHAGDFAVAADVGLGDGGGRREWGR